MRAHSEQRVGRCVLSQANYWFGEESQTPYSIKGCVIKEYIWWKTGPYWHAFVSSSRKSHWAVLGEEGLQVDSEKLGWLIVLQQFLCLPLIHHPTSGMEVIYITANHYSHGTLSRAKRWLRWRYIINLCWRIGYTFSPSYLYISALLQLVSYVPFIVPKHTASHAASSRFSQINAHRYTSCAHVSSSARVH